MKKMFNLTILSHVDVLNEFHCFTFLSLTSFRVLIDKVRANVLTEGKFQTNTSCDLLLASA